MSLHNTAIYAAILAIIMIILRTLVTMLRVKTNISIHHGENMQLAERIRWHGNFIENVPMALIVMALAEAGGAMSMTIHASGILLTISRILQPFGLRHDKTATAPRIIGGMGTVVAILIPVVAIFWQQFHG